MWRSVVCPWLIEVDVQLDISIAVLDMSGNIIIDCSHDAPLQTILSVSKVIVTLGSLSNLVNLDLPLPSKKIEELCY